MSLIFYTLGGAALTHGYKYFGPTAQVRKFFFGLRPVGLLGNRQVRSAWSWNKKDISWQSESELKKTLLYATDYKGCD